MSKQYNFSAHNHQFSDDYFCFIYPISLTFRAVYFIISNKLLCLPEQVKFNNEAKGFDLS